ncbi:MAG: hypothetical protein WCK89_22085, partial [bacterium]
PYAYSAPVVVAPPAPVIVQQAPVGHYETRRTPISEGRWEAYPVWVPEHSDESGRHVNGFYETRERWVQPLYEDRQVWVTP